MTRFTLTEATRKRPSIADGSIPRLPEDRAAAVEEWLDLLRVIGVDTATALASTHDALNRVEALARRARDARKLEADAARAAAKRLASDPSAPPRSAVAIEDLAAALGIAQASVWGTFVASDLASIIGPAHKAAVKSITAIAERISPHVSDVSSAARARCSDSWIQLEQAVASYETIVWLWCNLHACHAIPPGPGVKSGRHRVHTPLDVLYSDPAAAFRASAACNFAGLAHLWRVVHIVAAGKPTLGSLTATQPAAGDPHSRAIFDLADDLRAEHRPGTPPGPRPPSAQAGANAMAS